MAEIDFENGGREVNVVFAAADFLFHPLINLRGGIVTNPIGSFNQNHDAPKYEFINRPTSSTTIIPGTWSNAGFGLFGKAGGSNWVWGYEFYLTNGFDDEIINNSENRTWMPATKENEERFEESFNGSPLYTVKTAVRYQTIAEIGLSWMGGAYNKFEDDGLELDKKRKLNFFAIDFNARVPGIQTFVNGELVMAEIDVPETYSQQFGDKQRGGFVDIAQPVLRPKLLGWDDAVLSVAVRGEYADYNFGKFIDNGDNIFDDVKAIIPAISFRPTINTVLRINYRYEWRRDLLGNPGSHSSEWQLGFATYF